MPRYSRMRMPSGQGVEMDTFDEQQSADDVTVSLRSAEGGIGRTETAGVGMGMAASRRRAGGRFWCLPSFLHDSFVRFTATPEPSCRTLFLNVHRPCPPNMPPNVVRNQKYYAPTFVLQVLYEQFRMFFNLYFLLVAVSQFIPALRVGFLFTYIAPLVFVLAVTLLKEGYDDYKRFLRDHEANSTPYSVLDSDGTVRTVPSSKLRVGDLVVLKANERVPADMVLLHTSEKGGAVFIRTDQLDGETDWKLRRAPVATQGMTDEQLSSSQFSIFADKPIKDIYAFTGNLETDEGQDGVEPLSLGNTIWANTVLCAGRAIGIVVYSGKETRAAMNANVPHSKVGLVDMEINKVAKQLFLLSATLSVVMTALSGVSSTAWVQTLARFIILFSAIVPISLRVNMDMAKTVHSLLIMKDKSIDGTVVRSSFIPEELGRVSYLLSDKTGTLTRNEMVLKKIHVGDASFDDGNVPEIASMVVRVDKTEPVGPASGVAAKVHRLMMALSVCHAVNPTGDGDFQASSPDEVALVQFAKDADVTLTQRDITFMTVEVGGKPVRFEILQIFPFSSDTKRMGIIVRREDTGTITFYVKGADAVMLKRVRFSDWLEEECGNLSREGLRTLVVASKPLTQREYDHFQSRLQQARASMQDRDAAVQSVVESIEDDLQVLGLTGVEDKLQEGVKAGLETLRNAGVRVWMLTGDKVETATCIARSSHLVERGQPLFSFEAQTRDEAVEQLQRLQRRRGASLIIDGAALQLCLDHFPEEFAETAKQAPSVVACRCAPTQKAAVVSLLRRVGNERTCAIGDGGNDVAMIQAADVGVGIVGKEGKQASLAADFSILQFSYVVRLLLWHGRNAYSRTATIAQFVVHRGLIISIIQAVFSAVFFFAPVAVYSGWLVVGYSTVYTMLPVFSLVLDQDVSSDIAFTYPELYKELRKGRRLNTKTFLTWTFKSIYQGAAIMLLAAWFFDDSFINVIGITFTALILTELLMVALQVTSWHWTMVAAQALSLIIYMSSFWLLPDYFDIDFVMSGDFWWKTMIITLISCLPVTAGKFIKRRCSPPSYEKLAE